MKFDEVIKRLSQDIDKNGGQEKYQNEVIATLKSLQKEYAPTVEMTKKQYNVFKFYKDNLDFSACLGIFQDYNGETRMGIKFDDLKGELSDEDIMQAWLHPETIKIKE